MAKRLVLRSWRVFKAEPSGALVWFDPDKEEVMLFELEPEEDPRVADALERDDQDCDPDVLDQVKTSSGDQSELPF